jgi:hypothetical protein
VKSLLEYKNSTCVLCTFSFWMFLDETENYSKLCILQSHTISSVHINVPTDYIWCKSMSKCFQRKIRFIYKLLPTYLLIHKRIRVNCNTIYAPSTVIITKKYMNICFKCCFPSLLLIYLSENVCWEDSIVSNRGDWLLFLYYKLFNTCNLYNICQDFS